MPTGPVPAGLRLAHPGSANGNFDDEASLQNQSADACRATVDATRDMFPNAARLNAEAFIYDIYHALTGNGQADALKRFGSFLALRNQAGPAMAGHFRFHHDPQRPERLELQIFSRQRRSESIAVWVHEGQRSEVHDMIALHVWTGWAGDDLDRRLLAKAVRSAVLTGDPTLALMHEPKFGNDRIDVFPAYFPSQTKRLIISSFQALRTLPRLSPGISELTLIDCPRIDGWQQPFPPSLRKINLKGELPRILPRPTPQVEVNVFNTADGN